MRASRSGGGGTRWHCRPLLTAAGSPFARSIWVVGWSVVRSVSIIAIVEPPLSAARGGLGRETERHHGWSIGCRAPAPCVAHARIDCVNQYSCSSDEFTTVRSVTNAGEREDVGRAPHGERRRRRMSRRESSRVGARLDSTELDPRVAMRCTWRVRVFGSVRPLCAALWGIHPCCVIAALISFAIIPTRITTVG